MASDSPYPHLAASVNREQYARKRKNARLSKTQPGVIVPYIIICAVI
jgi:hypothetical protein